MTGLASGCDWPFFGLVAFALGRWSGRAGDHQRPSRYWTTSVRRSSRRRPRQPLGSRFRRCGVGVRSGSLAAASTSRAASRLLRALPFLSGRPVALSPSTAGDSDSVAAGKSRSDFGCEALGWAAPTGVRLQRRRRGILPSSLSLGRRLRLCRGGLGQGGYLRRRVIVSVVRVRLVRPGLLRRRIVFLAWRRRCRFALYALQLLAKAVRRTGAVRCKIGRVMSAGVNMTVGSKFIVDITAFLVRWAVHSG